MAVSSAKPNWKCVLIRLLYASAVLTYFEFGFAASHWNYHRFTNQVNDSDIGPVSGLKTWWHLVLLSRPIYSWLYFLQTLRPALGLSNNFKYNARAKGGDFDASIPVVESETREKQEEETDAL
jgi:hypothetical protein